MNYFIISITFFIIPLFGMQQENKLLLGIHQETKLLKRKQKKQQRGLQKIKKQIGDGDLTLNGDPMSVFAAITNLQDTTQSFSDRELKLIKAVVMLDKKAKEQKELLSLQGQEIHILKVQLERLAGIFLLDKTNSLPVLSRKQKERTCLFALPQRTSSDSSGSDPHIPDEPELVIPLQKQHTIEDLTPLSTPEGTQRKKKRKKKKKVIQESV